MMTCASHPRIEQRAAIARERLPLAHSALRSCRLCAHECGVNRLAGELGKCRAGAVPRCFSAQIDLAEEAMLTPTFAIALSGCDLRCGFCITRSESWNPKAGEMLAAESLAHAARNALAHGANSVMILGGEPTIHLPFVLEWLAHMPDSAALAWKTNAHLSRQARELLGGLFDVWVADYKFGNDECATQLAGVSAYTRTVRANLL